MPPPHWLWGDDDSLATRHGSGLLNAHRRFGHPSESDQRVTRAAVGTESALLFVQSSLLVLVINGGVTLHSVMSPPEASYTSML